MSLSYSTHPPLSSVATWCHLSRLECWIHELTTSERDTSSRNEAQGPLGADNKKYRHQPHYSSVLAKKWLLLLQRQTDPTFSMQMQADVACSRNSASHWQFKLFLAHMNFLCVSYYVGWTSHHMGLRGRLSGSRSCHLKTPRMPIKGGRNRPGGLPIELANSRFWRKTLHSMLWGGAPSRKTPSITLWPTHVHLST